MIVNSYIDLASELTPPGVIKFLTILRKRSIAETSAVRWMTTRSTVTIATTRITA